MKTRMLLVSALFTLGACTGGGGEGGIGDGSDFDGDFTGGFGSGRDNRGGGEYENLGDAIEDLVAGVCPHLLECGGDIEFSSVEECESVLFQFICGDAGGCSGPAPGSRADYRACIDAVNASCNLEDEPAACAGLVPEGDDEPSEPPQIPEEVPDGGV